MAVPVPGLPPIGISSGPALAESGGGAGGSALTGDFTFKGQQTTVMDVLKAAAPFVIIGGVFWLVNRKKR